MAYHFASVAHQSGLEVEVRLAGDAIEILKDGGVPDPGYNKRLLKLYERIRGERPLRLGLTALRGRPCGVRR